MIFIWAKGGADINTTDFIIEATDGDKKFHTVLPATMKVGEQVALKQLAHSYAEWVPDKDTLRTVLLKQFNAGVQTGDELAFTFPPEEGKMHFMQRTGEERERDERDASDFAGRHSNR